jgi:hypothetical protein
MESEKIEHLLSVYKSGRADANDIRQIEFLIAEGAIQLEDIEGFERLEGQLARMKSPEPSAALDARFFEMLQQEKKVSGTPGWKSIFNWNNLMPFPRLAFAVAMLLIGAGIGFFLRLPDQKEQQITALGQEISDLKEMMMLSLLEKESATDRLRAVNLTQDMDQASRKVTSALLQTLNNDENVNVRLAALDALRPYIGEGEIREALVRSIAQQKSPLVQVALAELMAALQEKDAIKELQKIIQDGETPPEVKKKIQETIQVI